MFTDASLTNVYNQPRSDSVAKIVLSVCGVCGCLQKTINLSK